MNYLWAGMILIGVSYARRCCEMEVITNAALDSQKEAVTLCITMIGIMSFWCGIMEIAAQAGCIGSAGSRQKCVRWSVFFSWSAEEHKAQEHITTNFIANILGLGGGNSLGLKAMKRTWNIGRGKAGRKKRPPGGWGAKSQVMKCTFLIMNISSLQLIPMNVIAYRSQYGSAEPAAIVGAGFSYGVASTGLQSYSYKNSGAKAKEIWYNQGEQISGKNRKSA